MNSRRPDRKSVLGTILAYELRMLLRDTRTILIAVVAPVVLFPLFIFVQRFVEDRDEERLETATYEYAVTGDEAGWARDRLAGALALDAADTDSLTRPATFEERTVANPDSALEAGELHLVVEGLSAAGYRAWVDSTRAAESAADSTAVSGVEDEASVPDVRAVRLRYRRESDFSRAARDRVRQRLEELRDQERDSVYAARGFPVGLDEVAVVEAENVASAEKAGGAFLGVAMTPLLLLLMLSGGSIVAADAISGEKERGTLETLLTTAASRREIVQAKLLAVMVVGLAVSLVNVANLAVYLGIGVIELPADLQIGLGAPEIVLLLALFTPLALLVSAVLLLVSGASKSYKEYQVYFFPVFLVVLIPSFSALLPGVELQSVVAFLPIAGVGLAVREILVGNVDWLFSAAAFLSTGALAVALALQTEATLSNERLISSSGPDEAEVKGGPALFPRQVLRWFAVMWALFFVASLWFGEDLGLRGQVILNLGVIFLGGSAAMIWRYRLPVRETLSLRAPHPVAWLGALVGAPSALILGIGVSEWVNEYVFPVPDEMLEAFGQAMGGPELGIWQLLFFVCVMPGVLEEIAFRGVLLHGLRKRFPLWGAVLLSGLIFGFFHVSLFRIIPTAWLGVVLGVSVVLTGSILPAILWHFLNNAIALVPAQQGWIPQDFTPPGWAVPVAAVVLAGVLWLMWKTGPRPRWGTDPSSRRTRMETAGAR